MLCLSGLKLYSRWVPLTCFRQVLAKTCSRMTTTTTFSRQNDADSWVRTTKYWENLLLVVVLFIYGSFSGNFVFVHLIFNLYMNRPFSKPLAGKFLSGSQTAEPVDHLGVNIRSRNYDIDFKSRNWDTQESRGNEKFFGKNVALKILQIQTFSNLRVHEALTLHLFNWENALCK